MTVRHSTLTGMMLLAAGSARADAPTVVVDIAPIHSLAAKVMDGIAEPVLLIEASASPHGYALRPSQARVLSQADLVVWVGEGLTPWLGDSLGALAGDAVIMDLMDADGLTLHPIRGRRAGIRDMRINGGHNHNGHGHRNIDPHLWLDPGNGRAIAVLLAEQFAALDPENATEYRANARAAAAEIDALSADLRTALDPIADAPYLVFHDAYQYFEARFGLSPAGTIALSDGAKPGARRLSQMKQLLRDSGARCVFAEPQFPERTVDTILRGSTAKAAVLDPMGASLEPGPELYVALLTDLQRGLTGCLKP